MSREPATILLLVIRLWLACLAIAGATSTGAAAELPSTADNQRSLSPIHTRFAIHTGFDRLVFKLPPTVKALLHQDGTVLSVRFPGFADVAQVAITGRRVLSMSRDQFGASLRLAPDVSVRSWRSRDMFVIDVFDPGKPTTGSSPSMSGGTARSDRSSGEKGGSSLSGTRVEQAGLATPASPRISPAGDDRRSAASPVGPTPPAQLDVSAGSISQTPPSRRPAHAEAERNVVLDGGPHALPNAAPHAVSVVLLRDVTGSGSAILVPFGPEVGAAAFYRGGQGRIVFDAPQSFDLSDLKDDPIFGGVSEQLLPDGMELRLTTGVAPGLRLERRAEGWVIAFQRPDLKVAQPSPITNRNNGDVIVLDASGVGRVLVVNDDVTGGRLLVGTQRVHGQHVGSSHVSAEAVIVPTWQGVVVQPISDRVLLRATQAGFELSSVDAPPLAVSWSDQQAGAWPDGRAMTRLFDFANLSPEALKRSLGQALRDAAAAPKLARFGPRLGVAQAMLAQGMDVEAQAVLHTAEADDPSDHGGHCAACLSALATWMSARASGVEFPKIPIDAASFGDSDEAALWKALLQSSTPATADRGAVVASTWRLLMSYPPLLRRLMLRPAADLLLEGRQDKALSAFLAAFPDASLDLVRANLARSKGKVDDSLRLYDQVAGGRDRLARADALEQAVLVRLAANRMTAASAAEALNGQLYAWRGVDRELRIRLRVAKLRAQAGEWRSALAMLQETDAKFPQSHAEVHAAKAALVADLLKGDSVARLNAIDLVAIADGTSDVFDDHDVGFAPALIDKMLASDLASRADPILRHLFQEAKDAATKAELGIRLAESMLDGGDPAAALKVLAASDNLELGSSITSRRALLRGRLLMQAGKPAEALSALNEQHGFDANELRASIMESQHDWANAAEALKPLVFDAVSQAKPPASRHDLVLRLARDEAQAGDQVGLHALRQTEAGQFQAGPDTALFALLTAEPVRSTADLPRSATEVKALRSVPAAIARAQTF